MVFATRVPPPDTTLLLGAVWLAWQSSALYLRLPSYHAVGPPITALQKFLVFLLHMFLNIQCLLEFG